MSLTTRRLMRMVVLASHRCRFAAVAACRAVTRRIICVTCGSCCSDAGDRDGGALSRDTSMSRDTGSSPTRRRCTLDPACCKQSVAVLLDGAARAIARGHSTR